jgi:hypothetical protein
MAANTRETEAIDVRQLASHTGSGGKSRKSIVESQEQLFSPAREHRVDTQVEENKENIYLMTFSHEKSEKEPEQWQSVKEPRNLRHHLVEVTLGRAFQRDSGAKTCSSVKNCSVNDSSMTELNETGGVELILSLGVDSEGGSSKDLPLNIEVSKYDAVGCSAYCRCLEII